MSATVKGGPLTWSMEVDDEGYRTYQVTHLVATTSTKDGPYKVLQATGLPKFGDVWSFGNDNDSVAYCTHRKSISIHQEKQGDGAQWYKVQSTFTTKPMKNCYEESIEDPLLMPPKVQCTFNSIQKEITHDRFGNMVRSSSLEQYSGPQVEFDFMRINVNIELNSATPNLPLLYEAMNCVNMDELWGMPPRTVKLSSVEWSEEFYGLCYPYYKMRFSFDIDSEGWDKKVADEGTKVLNGQWDRNPSSDKFGQWVLKKIGGKDPDPSNPAHFIRYKDWNGENARVLLDGTGKPAVSVKAISTGTGTYFVEEPGSNYIFLIQKYDEFDFTLLGIPTSLTRS